MHGQTNLYNGSEYREPRRTNNDQHPYFVSEDWLEGSVLYDGDWYEHVPLQYDITRDVVITEMYTKREPDGAGRCQGRRLLIDGHMFRKLIRDTLNALPETGFYDIYSMMGKTRVIARQTGRLSRRPAGKPKAAIVVIQEIFGVNHHIRSVCDRLAAEGYVAIAPSIFDRIQPDFQCGYSPDEIANARKFIANPDWTAMLRDTQAAIDAVKDVGPVGIIGFCLGGSIAYAAATKLSGLSAAVGYYGGAVVRFADDKPQVPTQLHFGEKDAGIPLTDVETIKAKRPDVEVHIYPGAQHGFHCDERASYDKASADIAWPRSLAFFAKHLKK